MYALFFAYDDEESLLRIFDKTKERRHVYQHWGEEGQRSATGPDNTRTAKAKATVYKLHVLQGKRRA